MHHVVLKLGAVEDVAREGEGVVLVVALLAVALKGEEDAEPVV